jgi:hypothetical protein
MQVESYYHLRTLDSQELAWVTELLTGAGGVAKCRAACMEILHVEWGNLSRVYLVREGGEDSYVKIGGSSRSKGGFFIKSLGCGSDDERGAALMRRTALGHLLVDINCLVRRQIISTPLLLEADFVEFWIPREKAFVKEAMNGIMTRWAAVKGSHLEPLTPDAKRYDPISYAPSQIRMISTHLWQLQKLGHQALPEGPGRLVHEHRQLHGYAAISSRIESAFGSTQEQLRERASAKADEIRDLCKALSFQLEIDPNSSIQEIARAFLERNGSEAPEKLKIAITSGINCAPFQERVFYAERDRQWPEEVIRLGRRISQIMVANEIVTDILEKGPLVNGLLDRLPDLEARYRRMEYFPMGVVLQDGHPLNFLQDGENLSTIGCDDISLDVAFVDLSNVYLYKIVRGFVDGKIDRQRYVELLDAVLLPEWVGEHRPNILDYCIASFWNHSRDLVDCYNLEPEQANRINLAVTLMTFTNELVKREQYDQVYRETLEEI